MAFRRPSRRDQVGGCFLEAVSLDDRALHAPAGRAHNCAAWTASLRCGVTWVAGPCCRTMPATRGRPSTSWVRSTSSSRTLTLYLALAKLAPMSPLGLVASTLPSLQKGPGDQRSRGLQLVSSAWREG